MNKINELKDELTNDPQQIGYLPLTGEVDVFEHPTEADKFGVHLGVPIKVKKIMKLVGNDAKNAELLNKGRAEALWGEGTLITAQDVADTEK